jgi:hypothetical protein
MVLSWVFTKSLQVWSVNQFVCVMSLATVVVHHILIQYPYQAPFFTSLYAYMVGDTIFVLLLYYVKGCTPLDLLKALAFFNFLYVCYNI